MRIVIGIDTGGTYTDAVLFDSDTGRVLQQNKSLTTHHDLKIGILGALDGLDPELCRKAEVAGLSTTLATNACVEGKLRRVRLLLMGIDREGIAKYGANYGFHDPDDIRYLPCRTTITGEINEEPDWSVLELHAQEWFADVEGCAICEIHGMRNNGVLEKKAAEIIRRKTGLPIACASTLFSGLSSLERAASAVLNAGLLPVTQEFMNAVAEAFRQRDINAPLLIVRSNGSLMGRDYSVDHAVETLLSGPAASALGGGALCSREQAVVVDIGGTTTDVALVEQGMLLMSDDGIKVGEWKTLVNGVFSTSFALGGDSAIRWDQYDRLTIGPDRIVPLCVLASRYPQVRKTLQAQLALTPAHTLPLHEFLMLERQDWRAVVTEPQDILLCKRLEEGPLSHCEAAALLGLDKYQLNTRALEQSGIMIRAGLTPTDLMHVRGDFDRYDEKTARLAAKFAAASLRKTVKWLCNEIYDRMSYQVFAAVSQSLLERSSKYFRKNGMDAGMQELFRLQWETRNDPDRLLNAHFRSNAVLVGIGGPTHLFLPEAAKALGAECFIPEFAATANAVGAVTGRMTAAASADIRYTGYFEKDGEQEGSYLVVGSGIEPCRFKTEEEALSWVEEALRSMTADKLHEQGAVGTLKYKIDHSVANINDLKVSTQVTVTATA
ncbi:MAG: hydantoinase/oxoprolinase family protein [Butyricicoccus sp.]|nr:hydantoinase/oxoprolinase family protein [Butyricicoccus sp.]MBQ8585049.1 hydantoinase/oxoprolinase family protein [Butyricicoccus sp.]